MNHTELRFLTCVLLLAAAILVAALLVDGLLNDGQGPFPFMWRDIALVHLAGAVPIALWFARAFRSDALLLAVSLLVFALAGVFLIGQFQVPCLTLMLTYPLCAPILRVTLAFLLVLPIVASIRLLRQPERCIAPVSTAQRLPRLLLVSALLLLPELYVDQATRHHLKQLDDLVQQGRIAEAHRLAHRLVLLDTRLESQGEPMTKLALHLAEATAQLEREVLLPLSPHASSADGLRRARQFAMLARTDEALALLDRVKEGFMPHAQNLRGTIKQAREEWPLALDAFLQARASWKTAAVSPDRERGLLEAITGIAYCRRKMGDYGGAELAYRERLTLLPSAESHFLLAQFYEDAQDTSQAFAHAREAMARDPQRFQEKGQRLIDQMRVRHFGCLSLGTPSAPRP